MNSTRDDIFQEESKAERQNLATPFTTADDAKVLSKQADPALVSESGVLPGQVSSAPADQGSDSANTFFLSKIAQAGGTVSPKEQIQLSKELKRVKEMLETYLKHLGYTETQISNRQIVTLPATGYHPLIAANKRDLAVAALALLSGDRQLVESISTPHQVGKFILAIIALDSKIEETKKDNTGERPSLFASRRQVPGDYKADQNIEAYKASLQLDLKSSITNFRLADHVNPRTASGPLRAGSHLYFYAVEALQQIWPFYFTAQAIQEQLDNSLVTPNNQMPVNILRNRLKKALKQELAGYNNQTPEKYRLLITQALAVFRLLECFSIEGSEERARMLSTLLSLQNFEVIRNVLTRPDNRDELNTIFDLKLNEVLNGRSETAGNLQINLDELLDRSAYNNLERALREALQKVGTVEEAPSSIPSLT